MMQTPIVVAIIVMAGTLAGLALLCRRMFAPRRRRDVDVEWLNRFSIDNYRPMERLLSSNDFEFLESQGAYHPRMGRQLRRVRCEVFRSYLACLRKDFERLEAAMLLCMTASREDKPELAAGLLKRRLLFTWAVFCAEWRLLLFGLGLGTVDVHGLIGSLDGMRVELGRMVIARQAVAA